MPDVNRPGYSVDDIFRMQAAGRDHMDEHRGDAPWTGHPPMNRSHARRVGMLGMSAQCLECGTICMANHELGAFVGPPDDPWRHAFPFIYPKTETSPAGATPAGATETAETALAPKPRPAGIPADAAAKGRSKNTPSRSPEARHAEYVRGKRRRVQSEA